MPFDTIRIDWNRRQICMLDTPQLVVRRTYRMPDGYSITGDGDMSFVLPAGAAIVVSVDAVVDQFGNATSFDGVPQWAVSDPAIASIAPADDGMSVRVVSSGQMATGQQLSITGDAILGEQVRPFTATDIFDVTAGPVAGVRFAYGPVEEVPPPA